MWQRLSSNSCHGPPLTPCLREAQEAHPVPPSWNDLVAGARPEVLDPDQFELWDPQRGWQHEAASRIESWWLDEFAFARMEELARALVRSQGGSGAGLALRACPTCRVTQLEPQLRVLLLRRLQLPLPRSVHSCRCGRPLDQFGHRTACARAGILGKRGYALESVVARICREAGGRVTTNVLLRELDFGSNRHHRGQWLWRQQDTAKSGDTRSWWVKSAKQVGGVRSGSWGPTVAGIPRLHQPTGQSTGTTGTADPPTSGRTGLANPLGSMVSCVVARAVAGALGADGDTPLVHDVVRICWQQVWKF